MATTPTDVLRLFVPKASFLAGSKRRQLGFDTTLKQMLLHNNVDDSIAMEWSDDSLQVLLAGAQTLTGAKRFNADIGIVDKGSLGYDAGENEVQLKSSGAEDLALDSANGTIKLRSGATDIADFIASASLQMKTGHQIRTAASAASKAPLFIGEGDPPSSPQDGDVWMQDDGLYTHTSAGGTVGPLGSGGGGSFDPTDIQLADATAGAFRAYNTAGGGKDMIRVNTDTPAVFFGNTTDNPSYQFFGNGKVRIEGNLTAALYELDTATASAWRLRDATAAVNYFQVDTDTPNIAIGNATNNPPIQLLGAGAVSVGGNTTITGWLDVNGTSIGCNRLTGLGTDLKLQEDANKSITMFDGASNNKTPALRIYGFKDSDPAGAQQLSLGISANLDGHATIENISGYKLSLNEGAAGNVACFADAEAGETPSFQVYGFKTGDAIRSLDISIDNGENNVALLSGVAKIRVSNAFEVDGNLIVNEVYADGASLFLQNDGLKNAQFFSDVGSGLQPLLRVSGRDSGDVVRTLDFNIDGAVSNSALISGVSLIRFSNDIKVDGKVLTDASAVGQAGIVLPHGTAPTAPVDGDLWTTTAGLFARINGSTVGPFVASAGVPDPLTIGTLIATSEIKNTGAVLEFQKAEGAANGVQFFSGVADGQSPLLKIKGFNSGGSKVDLSIGMGVLADQQAWFAGGFGGYYFQDGDITGATGVKTNSLKALSSTLQIEPDSAQNVSVFGTAAGSKNFVINGNGGVAASLTINVGGTVDQRADITSSAAMEINPSSNLTLKSSGDMYIQPTQGAGQALFFDNVADNANTPYIQVKGRAATGTLTTAKFGVHATVENALEIGNVPNIILNASNSIRFDAPLLANASYIDMGTNDIRSGTGAVLINSANANGMWIGSAISAASGDRPEFRVYGESGGFVDYLSIQHETDQGDFQISVQGTGPTKTIAFNTLIQATQGLAVTGSLSATSFLTSGSTVGLFQDRCVVTASFAGTTPRLRATQIVSGTTKRPAELQLVTEGTDPNGGAWAADGWGRIKFIRGDTGGNDVQDQATIIAKYEASDECGLAFSTRNNTDGLKEMLRITKAGLLDFKATMNASAVDPSTHGAPDDWIEVRIAGAATAYFIPAYLAT